MKNFKGVQSEVEFLATVHAMNFSGQTWSIRLLAEKLGWSKTTVERVLHDLIEEGVLSVLPGSGRLAAAYHFTGVYHGRAGVKIYAHPHKPHILVIETEKECRLIEISSCC